VRVGHHEIIMLYFWIHIRIQGHDITATHGVHNGMILQSNTGCLHWHDLIRFRA